MKRKLVGTCFASGPAAVMKTDVESFSFKLKTARWGAVIACVAQLSKVRAALRFAWNRRLFDNNFVSCEKDGDDPHTIKIDIVDQCLLSDYFLGVQLNVDAADAHYHAYVRLVRRLPLPLEAPQG